MGAAEDAHADVVAFIRADITDRMADLGREAVDRLHRDFPRRTGKAARTFSVHANGPDQQITGQDYADEERIQIDGQQALDFILLNLVDEWDMDRKLRDIGVQLLP